MRAKVGATAGLPRRWTPASPLSSGPSAITGTLSAIDRNHCPLLPESAVGLTHLLALDTIHHSQILNSLSAVQYALGRMVSNTSQRTYRVLGDGPPIWVASSGLATNGSGAVPPSPTVHV
jgi:hypothetical protein